MLNLPSNTLFFYVVVQVVQIVFVIGYGLKWILNDKKTPTDKGERL